jgi:hypothetical protein
LVTALVVLPTASSASVETRTSPAARHFRDAAGIVRHRPEGIERHHQAGESPAIVVVAMAMPYRPASIGRTAAPGR